MGYILLFIHKMKEGMTRRQELKCEKDLINGERMNEGES